MAARIGSAAGEAGESMNGVLGRFSKWRIRSLKACATFFYALSLLPSAFSARPNIVFIMADDLGYGDLGCYGNERVQTPHIDALAQNGIRFTDFHSSGPMCTPTRAATLTGCYQQRFGEKFDGAISGVRDYHSGLPHDAVTIAEILKETGYVTGCFGKWHLGYTPPFFPTTQGFDVFYGLGSGDGDFFSHVDRSGRLDWWRNEEKVVEEGYTTALLTKRSIEFIEANRDRPFFLYLPHLAIHFPWQGPQDPPHREVGVSYHDDKWGVIPDRSNVSPHVNAMIEAMDQSVGEIVTALDRHGLQENTLIAFTSDNGGYLRYYGGFENISSNGPLKGQKGQMYEGGHRVPTIVSWPNRNQADVTSELAHSTDWFPTFAKLTGVSIDDMSLDGLDLSPLLFRGQALPDRDLHWRMRGNYAVRSGPWKLAQQNGIRELFNLRNDLGETNDLSDRHPEKLAALQEAWEKWNAEMNRSAAKYE